MQAKVLLEFGEHLDIGWEVRGFSDDGQETATILSYRTTLRQRRVKLVTRTEIGFNFMIY